MTRPCVGLPRSSARQSPIFFASARLMPSRSTAGRVSSRSSSATLHHRPETMESALRRDERPIPLNCIRCGQPLMFRSERVESEQRRPDHVRVYFCLTHGFFHFSDTKQLTAGL